MATAQTLIDRALRLLVILKSGKSASTAQTADGLIALNAMLASWRNERLLAYSISEITHTLTVGDASYSIGSGGDIDTTRPIKIEDAFMRSGDDDYPVDVIKTEEWNAISNKAETGSIIEMLYYDPSMATGTIYYWPVPTVANVMHLFVRVPLTEFSAATDTVSLPPGWEQAIAYNLAVQLAAEYGKEALPSVMREAARSLGAIKRVNRPSMKTTTELSSLFSPRRRNIEADQ